MGITGLWKIVEPTSCEIPLECLEGKKLAVDVSIWIYQAQMAYPADSPYPHLRLLINRLCKLLFYKIRPVFVFDGPNVPDLKKQVLDSRRAKKLADDSILQNPKKLQHLKQIASGQLDDQQLAKSIETVISPTKRVLLNDVYSKEAASTSSVVVNLEEKERVDQIYVGSDFSDGEGPIDEKSHYDKIVEDLKIPENATRRQTIDTLVERRETMRKSRLNPSMIPTDSQDFSNFQMQRVLRRGRLNAQIDQIAKNPTGQGENSSKIHVLGPDGTQHILKYSHSDEVQQIFPGRKLERDLGEIFKGAGSKKEEASNLSLAIFTEACDFQKPTKSREITPEHQEIVENFKFQSKSGMLEAIARKRVRNHYRKCEEESSDDEFVDVLEEEVGTSTEVRVGDEKNANEVEWDPEKPDRLEKSWQNSEILDDDWLKMNYEDDDKTPEMYRDLQEFLTNCGIPWLEAPGEAEAQCVELERLGLVDGVISDDSDVWPFGVKNVYRHMFAKNKRVQRYSAIPPPASNDNIYCLEREDYISIGILAGGDYSSGLNKVGAIGALELVAEFVEVDRNLDSDNVENRIFKLLQIIEELFLNRSVDDLPSKSRQALFYRRHVVEANEATKIRQICENREAVRAYLHPNVDSSSEKFRWRKMNIELIRNIMQKRFDDSNFLQNELKNSISAFERWNTFLEGGGIAQMRLDRFFMAGGVAAGKPALIWSKKVTDALMRISRRSRGIPEEIIVESVKKRNTKKTTKKPVKKMKRVEKEEEKLNLSEESSDDSF